MSLGADGKPSGANWLDDRPVVVVGAAGQLGRTMVASLATAWPTVGLTRTDLDVSDAAAVHEVMARHQPLAIVNCAGYNQVDRAEVEPVAALEANAFAVLTLAARRLRAARRWCTTAATSCSTAKPIGRTSRTIGRSRRARTRRRSCSASGSRQARRRITCCASRACSAGRTGARAAWIGSSMPSWPVGRRRCSWTGSCRRATCGTSPRQPRRFSGIGRAVGLYHCVNTGAATWHDLAVEVRRQSGIDATLEPIRMSDVLAARRAAALLRDVERQASPGRHRDADLAGRRRPRARGTSEQRTRTEPTSEPENLRTTEPTHGKESTDHRRHGAGWVVPGGAAARQGLRGDRRRPPPERAQRLAHPAPARPHHAGAGRPARSALAHQGRRVVRAGRVLQPRGDVVRAGVVGSADVDRRVQRAGRDSRARGDSQRQPEDPLLSGIVQRDVRAGPRGAADRDDAVLPAQPVRRVEGVRPLHHGQLPRELQPVCGVRHSLQSRVAAPRHRVRHPQGDRRCGAHQARA